MSFHILTNTGKTFGPYGSILLARREARGKILGDKRISQVKIRHVFSRAGGTKFGAKNPGSFYESRQ